MRLRINRAGVVRLTLLTAAIFPVIAPPGPAHADADVLATIDGEAAVTWEDLYNHYQYDYKDADRAPFTAAEIRTWVDVFITARVLVLEAEAQGLGDDPNVINECEIFDEGVLLKLFREKLAAEAGITEEDVKNFYETDMKWRRYSLIEAKNRAEAEAAHYELEAGVPWDDVARKYSFFNEPGTELPVSHMPISYDGLAATRALFDTPVGQYTYPVPSNDGIRWQIYRVDKIVHGRIDTYEEAHEGIINTVANIAAYVRGREIAAQLRTSVTITRNDEAWDDLRFLSFAEFRDKWWTNPTPISTAGGVNVLGKDFIFLFRDFLYREDEGLTAYREKDPEDFYYVADRILALLEDQALMKYEAVRRGLEQDPSYLRETENYRAQLLTENFITRAFVAKLPPIMDDDCERYYEAHPDEFEVSEKVEVYLVALPDREKLRALYEEIKAGADIVEVNEAYNAAVAQEQMDMYDPVPVLPPEQQEWRGVVAVTREPGVEGPDKRFAEELRPRLYPFEGLNKLSAVFQLRDGRRAFYEPIFYRPFAVETLDDPGVKLKCQKKAWAVFYSSEEVDRRSREWLDSLRARHDIERADELFDDVAEKLNSGD